MHVSNGRQAVINVASIWVELEYLCASSGHGGSRPFDVVIGTKERNEGGVWWNRTKVQNPYEIAGFRVTNSTAIDVLLTVYSLW